MIMDTKVITCVVLALVCMGNSDGARLRRGANVGGGAAYGPADFDAHLNRIQQENLALQRQIQEQIRQQQAQAMGSWSTAMASINDGFRPIDPNSQLYSNTQVNQGFQPQLPMNIGERNGNSPVYSGGYGGLTYPTHYGNHYDRFDNMRFPSGGFPSPGGFSSPGGFPPAGGFPSAGGDRGSWAWGVANAGPGGNSQAGEIGPVAPGFESRFAEDLPSQGGNSYSSFSSSSSSSGVGPDGQIHSRKSVTTGINDNGRVSIKTVHDP